MKNSKNKLFVALLATGIAIMSGCSSILSPQEDHTRYFVLMPTSGDTGAAAQSATNGRELLIGLGPITLPRYLDRPEVITRVSDTEFSVSDNDRWGEPLDQSVSRVVTQDLSSDLPNSQIVPFPWSKKTPIDYKIAVDFSRFERTANGSTEVRAFWTIRAGKDNQLLRTGTTTAVGTAGGDQSSASAALSHGIGQLSHEIAQAIQAHGHG